MKMAIEMHFFLICVMQKDMSENFSMPSILSKTFFPLPCSLKYSFMFYCVNLFSLTFSPLYSFRCPGVCLFHIFSVSFIFFLSHSLSLFSFFTPSRFPPLSKSFFFSSLLLFRFVPNCVYQTIIFCLSGYFTTLLVCLCLSV